MDPQSIIRSLEQNTGGISAIKFAPVEFFDTIPRAYQGQITTDIVFQAGKGWLDIDYIKNTSLYTESENNDDEGLSYTQLIRLVINRDEVALHQKINLLKRRKLIFLIYDNNNLIGSVPPKLVGTIDNWLEYSRTKESGQNPEDLNKYTLTFTGRTVNEAPFYSGSV